MAKNKDDNCGCGHGHDEECEVSIEEEVMFIHDKLDALIELLIEKKIISEEAYNDKYEAIITEAENAEEEN